MSEEPAHISAPVVPVASNEQEMVVEVANADGEMQVEQPRTEPTASSTGKATVSTASEQPVGEDEILEDPEAVPTLISTTTTTSISTSIPAGNAAQPVIPQDLELIMNMVTNGNELAALSMGQTGTEVEVGSGSEDGAEEDSSEEDSDSDSNSDSSSSSAMSSIRGPPTGRTTSTPMSTETRDRLMAQLTTFYGTDRPGADDDGLNEDGEGYITADSDELEEEGEVDGWLGGASESDDVMPVGAGAKVELVDEDGSSSDSDSEEGEPINLMEMEDESEDEGGATGPSEPLRTKHEVEDDRAVVPSVEMLPERERLVLAGEIMSVMLNARPVEVEVKPEEKVTVEVEIKVEGKVEGDEAVSTPLEEAAQATKPELKVESTDPSVIELDVKPKPAPKNAKTKQKEKREQKQLAKSSGTIVVKALRAPLGETGIGGLRIGEDEGWLEEGSLVCLQNRRVLAVVAETFGPLSQPFYLLRLPPAPYPLPTPSELTVGTHVYYPASGNRSFVPVRMLKTDKRYKGTDASNLHDEEVSESEREWSDDEAEREAKRARKAGKGKAVAVKQRHWDAGTEIDVDDDSEFLDYNQGPAARDDDDGRSMAGMSTISTRGGRTGPVRYDDIVPSGTVDQVKGASASGRGARGGATRGRGRGGAGGDVHLRHGERDGQQSQRGRGRGDSRAGGRGTGERGRGRGGAGRNQDGGRQIGQGSGRGRGRGQGGFGSPGSDRPRDMSPTSMAIARATGQPGMGLQGTGIAQPMSAPMQPPQSHYGHVNPMMQMQQQQQQQQQQAMMGMGYGWQGQQGQGMGMPQMPFFYNPMQQGQQGFGGQFQQQGPNPGAFNPAFAARMMQMGMGMGGMPFQPSPQQPPQNDQSGNGQQ